MMKKRIILIYKLTAPNGKSYIGQTINLIKRLSSHLIADSPIGNAFYKYGAENFKIEILWITINNETANVIEIAAIALYNTKAPNGYNLTDGGEGARGLKWTEEQKKEKSKNQKGKQRGKDNPMYGRQRPDTVKRNKQPRAKETRRRQSETMSGRTFTEEHKRNISKSGKGIKPSKNTKIKMAIARTKYWLAKLENNV